jgi:O-antigen ligase
LLEFLIETGVFGLALFALFLNWFLRAGWLLWNADRSTQAVALAATLGIAAVLMHSLVDYPLRTAAISSLLALCCVLAKRPAPARGAQANPGPGAGKRETMLQI